MALLGHVHPSAGFLNLDLVPLVGLLCAAALSSDDRRARRLVLAAAAMALAVTGPLHDAAARSLTGHMAQHLVLILVVAPLVGAALVDGGRRRTVLARTVFARTVARATSRPAACLLAGAVHAAVVVVWHLPRPYDAAVDSAVTHGVEHLTLVATGAWWWATVLRQFARRGAPAVAVSLFGVATAGAAMGVFMMFAPEPLYALGGLDDQQRAGASMAVTGLVHGAAGLVVVAKTVQRFATPRPARVPAHARGAATPTVVLVCTCVSTLATIFVLALVAGPSAAGATTDELELGRDLYLRDCSSCHAPDGTGSRRGTSLEETGTAGATYYLATGRMPIAHPDAAVRRGEPAYDPTEIAAIVAYVATFTDGPDALDPEPSTASIARGGEQYRLHCAACHGAEGIGGALAFQGFAPGLQHASPADVANAMVVGPGAMPAFSATLSDDDIADVAAYVGLLQDPPRTGLALPGGRVGEGLVAWIAGLGAILVFVRWAGSRA